MIDKKGRIFGKINVIDLVVVILILCLAGSVIYNVFLKKDPVVTAPEKETGKATVTLRLYNNYPEWVQGIEEGDNLIIADALTDIQVLSVSYEQSRTTTTTSDGDMLSVEHPIQVDCIIQIQGSANRDEYGVRMSDTIYRIGDSREVRTDTFYGVARVIDVQFEPAQ